MNLLLQPWWRVLLVGLFTVKTNAILSLCSSAETDLGILPKSKMELFTTIDNAFSFDATSDFLKKFWIIICTDVIRFNNKDDKIPKQRHI